MPPAETSSGDDRSMGAVLVRSVVFFGVGFLAAFGIAFLLFHVGRRDAAASPGNIADDLALAGYMLLVTGAPSAAGFAVVTSPWQAWRRTPVMHRTWISLAAGFATFAAQLTGAVNVLLFLPLPAGFGWLAAAFRVLLPGIVAGVIALAIVTLLPRAPDGG